MMTMSLMMRTSFSNLGPLIIIAITIMVAVMLIRMMAVMLIRMMAVTLTRMAAVTLICMVALMIMSTINHPMHSTCMIRRLVMVEMAVLTVTLAMLLGVIPLSSMTTML
ncbi:hypothetical protein IWW56_005773 [Coemansia sp. RSA 2131]|nr:hypothetical protein IWW56_005773 [Coemansia sp. RSA 2131]